MEPINHNFLASGGACRRSDDLKIDGQKAERLEPNKLDNKGSENA
jgi:hypothetical protein